MTLDLHGITTKPALPELLKQQLHFPAWYGPNWDAFRDRLVAQPGLLNWQEFAAACPRDMAILRQIMADYAREKPGRRLVLA